MASLKHVGKLLYLCNRDTFGAGSGIAAVRKHVGLLLHDFHVDEKTDDEHKEKTSLRNRRENHKDFLLKLRESTINTTAPWQFGVVAATQKHVDHTATQLSAVERTIDADSDGVETTKDAPTRMSSDK